MTHEGALWFGDLTVPDPWLGLPLLCAATTYGMMRTQDMSQASSGGAGGLAEVMQRFAPLLSCLVIPAGYFTPAALPLVWTSNAAFSVGINLLQRWPPLRRTLGLAPLPPRKPLPLFDANQQQSELLKRWTSLRGTAAAAAAGEAADTAAAARTAPSPPPPGSPPSKGYLLQPPRGTRRQRQVSQVR
jgi:membrane protein insertase Oxa1/YidC/SpoIIIJ